MIKGLFTAISTNDLCSHSFHLSLTPPSPWLWTYLRSYWFTIFTSVTSPLHLTHTLCTYQSPKINFPPNSLLSKTMTQITKPPTPNEQGDLIISLEALEEGDEELPHQILGMIISDRPLNVPAVIRILTQAWAEIRWVHLEPLQDKKIFSSTVEDAAVGQRLMARSPWSIMGCSFSIHIWPSESRLQDVPLHLLSFWIQIHGLALGQMTLTNAKMIGEQIGSILAIKDPHSTDGWRGFLRIRIQFNTRNPLIPGFWFQRMEHN